MIEDRSLRETEEPPTCKCSRTEVRRLICTNNTVQLVRQCVKCGARGQTMSHHGYDKSKIPLFDERLREAWASRLNDYWKKRRKAEGEDWWARYREALESEHWHFVRSQVWSRCQGICEGCGKKQMEHVHHLTYEHLGREMLFEVAGVCRDCHEFIHGFKIGGDDDNR